MKIGVGSAVQVRPDVETPRYQWGQVKRGEVGVVASVESQVLWKVDFPSCKGWKADPMELMVRRCRDGAGPRCLDGAFLCKVLWSARCGECGHRSWHGSFV